MASFSLDGRCFFHWSSSSDLAYLVLGNQSRQLPLNNLVNKSFMSLSFSKWAISPTSRFPKDDTSMNIGQNILTHNVSKWQLDWNGLPSFSGGVWVKCSLLVSWVHVAIAAQLAADIKIRYITQVKISMTKISSQDLTRMYSFQMHLLVMVTGHSQIQCREESGKWFQNINDLVTPELYYT